VPLPHIEIRRLAAVCDGGLTDEDAAAILAGEKHAYVIAIVSPEGIDMDVSDADACYIAPPGQEGTYEDPRTIPDAALREYAADVWACETDLLAYFATVKTGAGLVHEGRTVLIGRLEYEPAGDELGTATGYVHAAPKIGPGDDDYAATERYHLSDLIPIEEKN
jgi:hypothetical protein